MTAAAGFDGHRSGMHESDERIQRERAEELYEKQVITQSELDRIKAEATAATARRTSPDDSP